MAYKGKAPIDPVGEMLEAQEQEKRRQAAERISHWLATPEPFSYPSPTPNDYSGPFGQAPGVVIKEPDSPVYHPKTPPPARIITPPLPPLVTEGITEEEMTALWDRIPAPVHPDTGPWYRIIGGFAQFRHGMPLAEVEYMEGVAARRRVKDLVMYGRQVPIPLMPQPGEVMIDIIDEDEDPIEMDGPIISESEEEENDEESTNGTNTSTITTEPTQRSLKRTRGRVF